MQDITYKFKGNLPPGFLLKEEEDFVYLFFGEEPVATFLAANVEPAVIEEAAKDYLVHPKVSSKS